MNTPDRNFDPLDDELQRRAREVFARACASTDTRHAVQLGMARRRALNAAAQPSHRHVWLPAAGALAACALALGVFLFRPDPAPSSAAHNAPTQSTRLANVTDADAPVDADSEQLDLYQNLDFYQWLAAHPDQGKAGEDNRR